MEENSLLLICFKGFNLGIARQKRWKWAVYGGRAWSFPARWGVGAVDAENPNSLSTGLVPLAINPYPEAIQKLPH